MEKRISILDVHKPSEIGLNTEPKEIINARKENIKSAINHITENISPSGYVRAATDYTWYKLMWFRDSSLTASSLIQAAAYIYKSNDAELISSAETAKSAALRIISKEWEMLDLNMPRIRSAVSMPLEDPEFKKLKNHLPARVDENGQLADINIDGRQIEDFKEAENPNSWLKQYDSVPLILHATSEFIKNFGLAQLPEKLLSGIKSNISMLSEYIIKTSKCPCADAWEQNADMLHSYSIGSAYSGLNSAMFIADITNTEIDKAKINAEIYGSGGLSDFIKEFFIKDKVLRKYRKEFGTDVEEFPKVDAQTYIFFAIFDPDNSLVDRETYDSTIEALEFNHLFRSEDGSKEYRSAMPKRYEGDRYFGGPGWPLLAALESYLSIKHGNTRKADYIIGEIEKLIKKDGFAIPEQEPLGKIFLNNSREGVNDMEGNKPACDLIWSSAEYLRAIIAELEETNLAISMNNIRRRTTS